MLQIVALSCFAATSFYLRAGNRSTSRRFRKSVIECGWTVRFQKIESGRTTIAMSGGYLEIPSENPGYVRATADRLVRCADHSQSLPSSWSRVSLDLFERAVNSVVERLV